jgi:hypothetical protein
VEWRQRCQERDIASAAPSGEDRFDVFPDLRGLTEGRFKAEHMVGSLIEPVGLVRHQVHEFAVVRHSQASNREFDVEPLQALCGARLASA